LMQALAKNGFAAASVAYRFAPQHKFPAQIEDVKCAVRFLRSKSDEWKLDTKNFAALGDSAGGHLSLLLGVTTKADNLEGTSGCADHDSSVPCVVNYYGPTDFTVPGAWNPVVVGMVSDFLGTADQSADVMKKASPIHYVRKDLPPIITFQGTNDQLVPEDQAVRFHAALKKAGVPDERCEIIKNAGHGFSGPDADFVNKTQLEFLKKYLLKK
jgi:acetyl esterase/lipase